MGISFVLFSFITMNTLGKIRDNIKFMGITYRVTVKSRKKKEKLLCVYIKVYLKQKKKKTS